MKYTSVRGGISVAYLITSSFHVTVALWPISNRPSDGHSYLHNNAKLHSEFCLRLGSSSHE